MTPPLVVTGLTKAFGALQVLRGVDLALEPGKVTALVGPNAAGKSTLIKCVLGLVRPDGGTIEVLGEVVRDDPHYRRFIGYMPQLPRFPENLTGQELLDLVSQLRHARPASRDASPPLASRLMPYASAELLSRPIRTLSGGTRQKLNALMALEYEVPILVLDEPTASLDPVASARLKDQVRERRDAGVATLLTSHVMAEVEELADQLVYLVEGRVRFTGSLDELRLTTGERRVERAIARLMQDAA